MFKYKIGQILKDEITGFTGVVMACSEYYTGCKQYGLLDQKLNKEGKVSNWQWFDEILLASTGKAVKINNKIREEAPGGPAPCAPQM